MTDGKAVFNVTSLSSFAVFAEDDDPPMVTTDSVTNVSADSAKLNGSVTADGGAAVTKRGFVYGTDSNLEIGGVGVMKITAGSGTGSFTADLTGLETNSAYYVRAYAINSEGTAYGDAINFITDEVDEEDEEGEDQDDTPGTGDNGFPWVWWLLCGISAAGIVVLIVLNRWKKTCKR